MRTLGYAAAAAAGMALLLTGRAARGRRACVRNLDPVPDRPVTKLRRSGT
jgi:hypothetical protein